ncbi:Hexosaminidase D [Frankliniella fusca]|uniref:Hexosaminidase D n=1 Tax=Frankliniella fusca TaxID=407009 RepID=A0AAE1LBW2_9NEOP|nr:Hexosaminidase D [Frankliniella fusca]
MLKNGEVSDNDWSDGCRCFLLNGLATRCDCVKPTCGNKKIKSRVKSSKRFESKYLACVSHIETNKETIIALAKQTFKERREFIMDEKYLLDSLLKDFKFFQAFKGEMIFLEFEIMFPGKGDNLIRDGHQYIEKLLKLGYTEAAKFASVSNTTQNECLNALMILVKYLPLPKRVYPHEKKMAVVAELDQIYQLVPVGSNVNLEISKRREAWKHPIQPCIMAMTNNDKVVSEYLVIGDVHSFCCLRHTMFSMCPIIWHGKMLSDFWPYKCVQ